MVTLIMATAPRTRGSTLALVMLKSPVKDCPAHAGIDPLPSDVT